jgi:hypothetical protein
MTATKIAAVARCAKERAFQKQARIGLFDPGVMGEAGPGSSTSEYGLALFNKGAASFAVIFCLATMDVVGSLEI